MFGYEIFIYIWFYFVFIIFFNEEIVVEFGWIMKVIKDIFGVILNIFWFFYGDIDDCVWVIVV